MKRGAGVRTLGAAWGKDSSERYCSMVGLGAISFPP